MLNESTAGRKFSRKSGRIPFRREKPRNRQNRWNWKDGTPGSENTLHLKSSHCFDFGLNTLSNLVDFALTASWYFEPLVLFGQSLECLFYVGLASPAETKRFNLFGISRKGRMTKKKRPILKYTALSSKNETVFFSGVIWRGPRKIAP